MGVSGFDVHHLDEVDSTNDWVLAAARSGAADRTVAIAAFQRRGRGRLDRRWEAPAGSALLCSVLLRLDVQVEDRHLAAVAVGLAALEAVHGRVPVAALKWPNDLVVGDRKLGGILAETDGRDDDGTCAVVVGLGVNLTWSGPPDAEGTSILLEGGAAVTNDELLSLYLDALDRRDRELRTIDGRLALVREYRTSLSTLGRRVRVELHDETFVGEAVDVTDAGHLVVDTPSGRRVVAAGDVVHVRPSGQGPSKAPE